MIKLKIIINSRQRRWFDEYAKIFSDRITVLQSRSHNSRCGKRDHIVIHGKIVDMFDFMHYTGNKHCHMTAVRYVITPYVGDYTDNNF